MSMSIKSINSVCSLPSGRYCYICVWYGSFEIFDEVRRKRWNLTYWDIKVKPVNIVVCYKPLNCPKNLACPRPWREQSVTHSGRNKRIEDGYVVASLREPICVFEYHAYTATNSDIW